MLSYYQSSASLAATDTACDIATKAFRLLQSINSATRLFHLLTSGDDEMDQPVVFLLKGMEQALYV